MLARVAMSLHHRAEREGELHLQAIHMCRQDCASTLARVLEGNLGVNEFNRRLRMTKCDDNDEVPTWKDAAEHSIA
jgi:hypothetical protein